MKDFLNKVSKTASSAASKAGVKAGELIEIGKLKGKISSKKQDVSRLKKSLGEYCYELYKDGKIDDATILEKCEKMKANFDEIATLEDQIKAVKSDYDDVSEEVEYSEDE